MYTEKRYKLWYPAELQCSLHNYKQQDIDETYKVRYLTVVSSSQHRNLMRWALNKHEPFSTQQRAGVLNAKAKSWAL
jgi:hypothetical protein